jgi:hypothetical protein
MKMNLRLLEKFKQSHLLNHITQISYGNNQEHKLHSQIIYYNNLILAIVVFFILVSVLILLEDNDTYSSLSGITFLLLFTFNLLILVVSHTLTKQFFYRK